MLSSLASAYASLISTSLSETDYRPFDVIFGPAYKGIPLASCTALILHRDHNIEVGFGYDRKEAKDHGEGGVMVGSSVAGKRVLILDDVMTSGTAVRNSVEMIRKAGGDVVGVVLALDRQEIGKEGRSTVQEMEDHLGGKGRVKAILKMKDLMSWLEQNGREDDLRGMQEYREQYGVKE
jgi:orotate phosphoribosyltransferase